MNKPIKKKNRRVIPPPPLFLFFLISLLVLYLSGAPGFPLLSFPPTRCSSRYWTLIRNFNISNELLLFSFVVDLCNPDLPDPGLSASAGSRPPLLRFPFPLCYPRGSSNRGARSGAATTSRYLRCPSRVSKGRISRDWIEPGGRGRRLVRIVVRYRYRLWYRVRLDRITGQNNRAISVPISAYISPHAFRLTCSWYHARYQSRIAFSTRSRSTVRFAEATSLFHQVGELVEVDFHLKID